MSQGAGCQHAEASIWSVESATAKTSWTSVRDQCEGNFVRSSLSSDAIELGGYRRRELSSRLSGRFARNAVCILRTLQAVMVTELKNEESLEPQHILHTFMRTHDVQSDTSIVPVHQMPEKAARQKLDGREVDANRRVTLLHNELAECITE
jgi:hypothetical protein